MEPLGTADSSIDAAWDFSENQWYPAVIDKVRELGPTMVRFGGNMIDYYHWEEGVGGKRIPMINHWWGGIYHNQVGTHEIVDFCRKVNAQPFFVVNMESDGFDNFANPKNDLPRIGTVREAAEWVNYCNNPDNSHRIANGAVEPFDVKYWQLGNETSYSMGENMGFSLDACYDAVSRFADAMKNEDSSIKLVGWGDKGVDGTNWSRKMSQIDDIEMLAFHHHFDSGLENSPLTGTDYRKDPENTWYHLMNAYKSLNEHIEEMRADCGDKHLAITEGHFCLPGRNRNEVLSSWGAGVAYARCLNTIMRHSDIIDIATMADFFGSVWQVNALMIPAPIRSGKPYLQPVGAVMSLFSHHQGEYMLDVSHNGAIDAVASVTDNTYFLHFANTDMNNSQEIGVDLGDKKVSSMVMYYIAESAETEITPVNMEVFAVKTIKIEGRKFVLPAAAVAAVEITLDNY